MKIFVLSTSYTTSSDNSGSTPIVHYFAREWVKQGHKVTAFHLRPKFPRFYYTLASLYRDKMTSMFGTVVPTEYPSDYTTVVDGVEIHCITYKKYKPHSRIKNSYKESILNEIEHVCKQRGIPDIFIGHWENPQLDILPLLKSRYGKPVCLVFHSNDFILEKSFGKDYKELLKQIDVIGFRNPTAKMNFEKKCWRLSKSFIAYSGVSEEFLQAGRNHTVDFKEDISKFVFVGSLMQRKHPDKILNALEIAYPDGNFDITYIGNGDMKSHIESIHRDFSNRGKVNFPGKLKRNDIISYLEKCQVFIMISEMEIYGLVYLEAMSMGLIPIGSKGEGIDGIIKDGYNGFLCTPGNYKELVEIINRIRKMTRQDLLTMSENAKNTALLHSDSNCAREYLKQIDNNLIK